MTTFTGVIVSVWSAGAAAQPVEQEGLRYSGFNLFDPDDENLLCAIVRGEFNISGLQNKTFSGRKTKLLSNPGGKLRDDYKLPEF